MTEQPSILDIIHGGDTFVLKPLVRPEKDEGEGGPAGSSELERQFLRFHELNPHVYSTIVEISLGLQKHGLKRTGISMVFERMRWMWAMQTRGDDYKLNNNYRAFYARMVMDEHPKLQGFFETRVQKHRRDENVDS